MHESIFSLAATFKRPDLAEIGNDMIEGKTNFVDYKTLFGGENTMLYYTRLPINNWSLGIVFPKKELFADLHSLFILLLVLGIGGIIITFITITLISKKFTRPIKELALAAVDIGQGNFDAILPPIKTKDEIGMLTHSFEAMKKELKKYILNLEETTAAKNKMESELKIAHDIQQGIIPKIFPPFPDRDDVDLFAILDPAREVGGDLYDFFFLDDKNLAFAIGDVSGKGVPASLFMAITRTLFRAKAVAGRSVSQIVSDINQALCIDNENAMFVTFFLGIINLENGEIDFCNAGHNYPYILRSDATIEKLAQTHGTALGLFDTIKYKSGKIKINKTETLVLYTDGIPEAMDIQQNLLGEKSLETMLQNMGTNKSPREITNTLLNETRKFTEGAEQSDDITILILTYYLDKVMNKKEDKHLNIENRIDEIHKVENFIEQLCEEWNIGFAEMHKVNLAMEEIVSNIINYGFRDDKNHTIEISASYESEVLKLTIVDDAIAFNPLEHQDPNDMDKSIEEREIGGLGIFFVKKMMDRVEYRHESNHNILIIEKMISHK
ncbi:MAG: SpoIIE family protein phosphatase [Bacteroidales bacterium]|nr:SpoIIE family protein phosphatase [Bacteroidales bacterium]